MEDEPHVATIPPPSTGAFGSTSNTESTESEALSLREFLGVAWRRRWVILLVTAAFTLVAYVYAARQPDMYQASSALIYESQIDVSNPLSQYTYTDPYERDLEMRAINSILASPDMISRAEVILDRTYGGDYASNAITELASEGSERDGGGDSAPDVPSYSVESSLPESANQSSVGSNVASITGMSTDAGLSSAAANAYSRAFVEWRQERQKSQIAKAVTVVEDQMDRYRGAAKTSADYLILQERLRDLQILSGTATGNFRVLVPAQTPEEPFEPHPVRSGFIGLGLGLFLGIGVAFLMEQFDTRLHRQEEVARILRQPILGRIPRVPKRLLEEGALVTLRHPEGGAAEAFRMIRTNLEFMSVDAEIGSLLVTSCVQGEGKSVSVANLAVSLAYAGKKVVVVDGDLRRPRLHTYFGIDNKTGVSTVVTGQTQLSQGLRPIELAPHEGRTNEDFAEWAKSADARSRLYVLPSGPLPPNPGEIVNSRRFGQMITALKDEADLVIVDSPAMLAVGDTAALAAKVDGLVFLVDMHVVKRPLLLQAAEQLAKLPVKHLGVIVRAEGVGSGRYGYYGSPYGYYEQSGNGRRGGRRLGPVPSADVVDSSAPADAPR